jgi:hypothetical protein
VRFTRPVLLPLAVAVSCVTLAGCGEGAEGPRGGGVAATPAGTAAPAVVALPYSWEEAGLKITVLQVVPAKTGLGVIVPEGYRQYTVNLRYENLLQEDWGSPSGGAGLDEFKLKTDQDNLYKPRFSGGTPFFGTLKPRQEIMSTDLYIFEIRTDETPVELWGFDDVNGESRLVYIFALD